jgi:hypothetical protein
MKNLAVHNGVLTFEAKLVQPNDSYCSKEWWVPTDYPELLSVTWLIMETGGYMIDQTQTVVGYDLINGEVSKIDWDYKFGDTCNNPAQEGDNDYAPAAIMKLQTTNNGDMFVTPRSPGQWFKSEVAGCSYSWQTGRFFLQPHDGVSAAVRKTFARETMGYLLFDPHPHVIDCAQGMSLVFVGFSPVSNVPVTPDFTSQYDASVGTFGVFASLVTYSGGDAFAIRSYFQDGNMEDVWVYLQVWSTLSPL